MAGATLWVACGNELQIGAPASEGVEARAAVQVGTRPVCGNGILEGAEECDDGNAVQDDGCDARCQAPCPADTLPVVGCGPGRRFVDHLQLYSHKHEEWVDASTSRETQVCETVDGQRFEIAVCRSGNCLNILAPLAGARVCSRACVATDDCPADETCVRVWADGPAQDTPEQRRPAGPQELGGRCLPAVGGGVGARCGTCGEGLDCNQVTGAPSLFICMPGCEDDLDCPAGARCAPASSVHTQDLVGLSCFQGVSAAPGTLVAEGVSCEGEASLPTAVTAETCARGCASLYGCGLCFTDEAGTCQSEGWCLARCMGGAFPYFACVDELGCDMTDRCEGATVSDRSYCSRVCAVDGDCPAGWSCVEWAGEKLCAAPSAADLRPAEPFVVVPERTFPDPDCPADVDTTCTFESDCDPDCARISGCGEVGVAGQCQHNTLRYCEQHRLTSIDCGARDLRCGFDPALARFDCLGASE